MLKAAGEGWCARTSGVATLNGMAEGLTDRGILSRDLEGAGNRAEHSSGTGSRQREEQVQGL